MSGVANLAARLAAIKEASAAANQAANLALPLETYLNLYLAAPNVFYLNHFAAFKALLTCWGAPEIPNEEDFPELYLSVPEQLANYEVQQLAALCKCNYRPIVWLLIHAALRRKEECQELMELL